MTLKATISNIQLDDNGLPDLDITDIMTKAKTYNYYNNADPLGEVITDWVSERSFARNFLKERLETIGWHSWWEFICKVKHCDNTGHRTYRLIDKKDASTIAIWHMRTHSRSARHKFVLFKNVQTASWEHVRNNDEYRAADEARREFRRTFVSPLSHSSRDLDSVLNNARLKILHKAARSLQTEIDAELKKAGDEFDALPDPNDFELTWDKKKVPFRIDIDPKNVIP